MKTKVTNRKTEGKERYSVQDRDDITFTVFAVFFVIALGMLMLTHI